MIQNNSFAPIHFVGFTIIRKFSSCEYLAYLPDSGYFIRVKVTQ
jgi:hypothetical protein